jgi:hypothetical protein
MSINVKIDPVLNPKPMSRAESDVILAGLIEAITAVIESGSITHLTHKGERIAAIVPAIRERSG